MSSAKCVPDGVRGHILLYPSKNERGKADRAVPRRCCWSRKEDGVREPGFLLDTGEAGYLEGNVISVLLDAW